MERKVKIFICILFVVAFVFPQNVFAATPFTVGVSGDFGPYPATSFKTFQKIGQLKPNLFLTVGDFSYNTNPESDWCKMVKDNINIGAGKLVGDTYGETYPFELLSGDHEDKEAGHAGGDTGDGFIGNYVKCLPDRANATVGPSGLFGYGDYYIDYPQTNPNTRFIALAPLMNFSIPPGPYTFAKGDVHYNWASQVIDDARAKGITWIIVFNHENYITMGTKGNGIGADFFNLMLEKKIDLLLQGNDHNYQRSKQIALNPATCPSIPSATAGPNMNCLVDDGSDNSYEHGKGMVLVITGTGGINHYNTNPADARAPYFAKWMGNTTEEISYGYTQIQVTDTTLNVSFVPSVGSFTDNFSIVTGSAQPTPTSTPPQTPTPAPTLPAGQSCQKLFIPAYFYPGTLWTQATAAGTKVSLMVMNPYNGPNTSPNANYVTAVNQAKAAGIKVLGYVYTQYGARSVAVVKADIDKYASWYKVDGIFFDEAASSATSANVSYYQDLTNYVKATDSTQFVMFNPGVVPAEQFVQMADSLSVFENDYSQYASWNPPAWVFNYPAAKFTHLLYNAPATELDQLIASSKQKNAGHIYITNDVLTNPWDTLPSYWTSEIGQMCSGIITPTPASKPGDANGDNIVNETDYTVWLSHFGQSVTGVSNGDFNGSGQIDGVDYTIWLNNYGK